MHMGPRKKKQRGKTGMIEGDANNSCDKGRKKIFGTGKDIAFVAGVSQKQLCSGV